MRQTIYVLIGENLLQSLSTSATHDKDESKVFTQLKMFSDNTSVFFLKTHLFHLSINMAPGPFPLCLPRLLFHVQGWTTLYVEMRWWLPSYAYCIVLYCILSMATLGSKLWVKNKNSQVKCMLKSYCCSTGCFFHQTNMWIFKFRFICSKWWCHRLTQVSWTVGLGQAYYR